MFYSRELKHKINRFYERCLHVPYHDLTSLPEELLQNDNSASILHRSIQVSDHVHTFYIYVLT